MVINKEQTFGEVKKRFEQEHPISEADVKKNETIMNRIKARVERKKYNAMVGHPDDGFNSEVRQGVKQYQESLAFGSSFITLMFLGFILGFYIGKYAFGLSEIH